MNTLLIPHLAVQHQVMRLHTRVQDFDEGDVLHRLGRFTAFVFQPVPLSEIDLNEFSICEDTVVRYMAMHQAGQACPPIVFDAVGRSIIDGLHRANALARLRLGPGGLLAVQ